MTFPTVFMTLPTVFTTFPTDFVLFRTAFATGQICSEPKNPVFPTKKTAQRRLLILNSHLLHINAAEDADVGYCSGIKVHFLGLDPVDAAALAFPFGGFRAACGAAFFVG